VAWLGVDGAGANKAAGCRPLDGELGAAAAPASWLLGDGTSSLLGVAMPVGDTPGRRRRARRLASAETVRGEP